MNIFYLLLCCWCAMQVCKWRGSSSHFSHQLVFPFVVTEDLTDHFVLTGPLTQRGNIMPKMDVHYRKLHIYRYLLQLAGVTQFDGRMSWPYHTKDWYCSTVIFYWSKNNIAVEFTSNVLMLFIILFVILNNKIKICHALLPSSTRGSHVK